MRSSRTRSWATAASSLLEIPITNIRPNPHQPRTHFDEESLSSLTASIRELGVLQPVLVRAVGEDQYELIAGERRWRAARRAGLPDHPGPGPDGDATWPASSRHWSRTCTAKTSIRWRRRPPTSS